MTKPVSHGGPDESDDQFVTRCRMPDVPFAAKLAIAVRREVARRAGLSPQSIHAADRLPEDLGDLFNRESLDTAEFVMELEEQLGVAIPDWTTEVFSRESVTVAELASGLCRGAAARGRWW